MPKSIHKSHPNPFVEWFINSDVDPVGHLQMLRSFPEPRSPKIQAMIYLREAIMGLRPFGEALRAAEEAYDESSDPDLHLLFLLQWINALSYDKNRWPQLQILGKRLLKLVKEETPNEIKAWVILIQSFITLKKGDTLGWEKQSEQMLSLLEPDSPHLGGLGLYYNFELLRRGRGTEVLKIPELNHDVGNFPTRLLISRFVNFATTGLLENALQLLPEVEQPLKKTGSEADLIDCEVAKHLVSLLQEHKNLNDHSKSGANSERNATDKPEEPAWVVSTRYLLLGDTEKALSWARIYADRDTALERTIDGFDEYGLIRAELAAGNQEAARRLLLNRRNLGSVNYIDDLFWTRVELLAGNRDTAVHHFSLLLAAIEKYQAQGRLEFELRLACEIAPADLVELSRKAGDRKVQSFQLEPLTRRTAIHKKETRAFDQLIYSSSEMATVRNLILNFTKHDVPLLITGETGTGKDLIARAVHDAGSRRSKTFLAINLAAIPEMLIESELFGHKRGSFTGANLTHAGLFREAGEGTIFLDEIGEISPKLQVALLRVLETGEVRPVGSTEIYHIRCRIIAATNADLVQLANIGRFRQDLVFRLKRLEIPVPPLRNRPDDILALARHFMDLDRESGVHVILSPQLETVLCQYDWPGNVRELRNVIERMRLLNSDKLSYDVNDFPLAKALPVTQEIEQKTEYANLSATLGFSPQNQNLTTKITMGPKLNPKASLPGSPAKSISQSGADFHFGADASLTHGRMSREQVRVFLAKERSLLRQLDHLRELFYEHEKLRVSEIIQILNISRATATRYINRLLQERLIRKVEPNASPRTHYYILKKK